MRDPTPQITRLKDYTPPAFLIETVDLEVDLFEDHARVRSRLRISRNPKAKDSGAPLALDAEDLEFESASLDGRELTAGELILESFNRAKNYENIETWARRLRTAPASS